MLKAYVVFTILCIGLTASLLSSEGGWSELMYLEKEIQKQQSALNTQIQHNQMLKDHIVVLQNKPEAIETIAREQLGLVKPGEIFVEVIDYRKYTPEPEPYPIADSLQPKTTANSPTEAQ